MDKIYEHANDLHVVATKIYATSDSAHAYKNTECTEMFTASELKDAFIKGALIYQDGFVYNPTHIDLTTDGYCYINFMEVKDPETGVPTPRGLDSIPDEPTE